MGAIVHLIPPYHSMCSLLLYRSHRVLWGTKMFLWGGERSAICRPSPQLYLNLSWPLSILSTFCKKASYRQSYSGELVNWRPGITFSSSLSKFNCRYVFLLGLIFPLKSIHVSINETPQFVGNNNSELSTSHIHAFILPSSRWNSPHWPCCNAPFA